MTSTRIGLYAGAGLALAAALGFTAARLTAPKSPSARPAASAPHVEAEAESSHDAVAISTSAAREAGIATETVALGGLSSEVLAQATVAAAPDGQAVLTAHAAGSVTRIFKRLGDPVRAGETVALVESREAAQVAADRSVAAAKAGLATKTLARERRLDELGVSARQDFEQAQAETATAAAEVRRAQAAASAVRVTGDGRSVAVASPISGRITAAPASLGAFVASETELFRVADPRRIQIEAQVTAPDAARIAPGSSATIEDASGAQLSATVRSVTPALNPETRSATVVLSPTGVGSLQPGQLARVRIRLKSGRAVSAMVVPEDAVQTIEGRSVVFVRAAQGFKVRPVTLGQRNAGRVEITAGLKPGEEVATRNAFLLKAELGKPGEEEGH